MIDQFRAAMRAVDCTTDSDIIPDDRVHRFRIIGDKKDNGSYQLAQEGAFAYGWFINHKEGVVHKWHSKTPNMSKADMEELRHKISVRRAAAEKERRQAATLARKECERIWARALPCTAHPYLTRKGVKSYGLKQLHNILLIPMADSKGIASLQFISPDGEKRFKKDAKTAGAWFTIPGDAETVAVCEGYATGASVAAATGWTVLVMFNSGNMKAYTSAALKAHSDAEVVICADDDRWTFRTGQQRPAKLPPGDDPLWTEWRRKDMLINTGARAAEAAKASVGGMACCIRTPRFVNSASRPTDWNDLAAAEGLEAVRAQLTAPTQAPAEQDNDQPPEAPPMSEAEAMEQANYGLPIYDPESMEAPVETGPFKIMGYNEGIYYYMPRSSGQLIALSASAHSKNNLFQLAPRDWWQERFPTRTSIDWDLATDALIQMCMRRGVFKQDTMVRGAGVWIDKGRVVAHMGDKLLVDGVEVEPFNFGSGFVYPKSVRLYDISNEALGDIEAQKLVKIFELMNWRNPISALLAAGWTALAPICGALRWRPHIYIDGEMGSGKSWVNDAVIHKALGRCAIRVGSGSSEAGLRRTIGHDARPIIMDEMEGEDKKQKELRQGILLMARKASSGESIVMADGNGNGTKVYQIYSMFSMSSINTGITQRADLSRFSHLELIKNTKPNSVSEFRDMQAFVNETLTEEYVGRLIRRTVNNAKTILKNCQTFSEAAAVVLRNRRAGDQIGPMLAGVYSLYNTKEISQETAEKWIEEKDWSAHTAINEKPDHEKLFDYIMTSSIIISGPSRKHYTQVGTAISVAFGYDQDQPFSAIEAKQALMARDIKVKDDSVWLRKPSQHIARLLAETPWETAWHKSILLVNGLAMSAGPQAFGNSSAYVIIIPRERFIPEGAML